MFRPEFMRFNSCGSHAATPTRFTNRRRSLQIAPMDFENPVVWIVLGLIVLGIVVTIIAPRFSTEARLERRRRKNNARVVNKSRRPTVKFSVRTKDDAD